MNKLPSKVTADALDHILAQSTAEFNVLGGKLTHCMVTLPCGFIITGESSCVSPAEYDKELGEALSQKKAIAKLWELEAYLLSKDLYEPVDTQGGDAYRETMYNGWLAKQNKDSE